MASLVDSLDDVAMVEWSLFGLSDDDRVPPGETHWGMLDPGDTMATTTNGVIFRSAGYAHHALVRLEGWDGPPPVVAGWDRVWDDRVSLTSGDIRLSFVAMGVSDRAISLGAPGDYHIRAHSRGGVGETPEYWLIRLWPVAADH